MNILALDTSMQACSVAVMVTGDDRKVFSAYEEIGRGHAERLMAMIDDCLAQAGIPLSRIDRFAVSRGPGTFTGVRIGLATARGLALACNKPLVGFGTLQVLARGVPFEQPDYTGIAVDARRGEIYWQLFRRTGPSATGLQPVTEPLALTAEKIAQSLAAKASPLRLAGSGAEHVAASLASKKLQLLCQTGDLQPRAADLAELAAESENDSFSPLERVSPLYLRPADAKIQTGYAIDRQ